VPSTSDDGRKHPFIVDRCVRGDNRLPQRDIRKSISLTMDPAARIICISFFDAALG
jgi:hypothetical protein